MDGLFKISKSATDSPRIAKQRRADKSGVKMLSNRRDIARIEPTLSNAECSFRQLRNKVKSLQINAKILLRRAGRPNKPFLSFEFAAINADDPGTHWQRGNLHRVMNFKEGFHPEFLYEFVESLESCSIEDARHQEDGIGSKGARLPNLIFTDDEILS